MGQQEHTLKIPGMLDHVRLACDFVVEQATRAGLGNDGVFQCQLSIEEICTNVIEHGYQFHGEDKTIEIVCRYDASMFSIEVIDEAPQFNPLDLGEPDPSTPLYERKTGGWGVYFVKQYMDDIQYTYRGDRNHLTLTRHINASKA